MPMKMPEPQKREKGQSVVELAISMILLLLILAGVVDLGRAIFSLMAMQDAAEEGVVYGVAFPTSYDQIARRVTFNLPKEVQPANITVAVLNQNNAPYCTDGKSVLVSCPADLGSAASGELQVLVRQKFQITMPFLGTFTGQEIPLNASANGDILRP